MYIYPKTWRTTEERDALYSKLPEANLQFEAMKFLEDYECWIIAEYPYKLDWKKMRIDIVLFIKWQMVAIVEIKNHKYIVDESFREHYYKQQNGRITLQEKRYIRIWLPYIYINKYSDLPKLTKFMKNIYIELSKKPTI